MQPDVRAIALFALCFMLAPVPALADEEAERLEALREGATEDEAALLDQARAALDASSDPLRDEVARDRAVALADDALTLVETRRAARDAHRAHEAAIARRDAAVERRALAIRRREAATSDLHRREGEVTP